MDAIPMSAPASCQLLHLNVAALTEDSSWRIVTGETGLTHTRAASLSVALSCLIAIACPRSVSFAARKCVDDVGSEAETWSGAAGRQWAGAFLPIVNDEGSDLLCRWQLKSAQCPRRLDDRCRGGMGAGTARVEIRPAYPPWRRRLWCGDVEM